MAGDRARAFRGATAVVCCLSEEPRQSFLRLFGSGMDRF
jgi:hypothetical protein